MPDDPQLQLVRKAVDGDRRAFEELMRPLLLPGYRLAYGMLHDREAAEDAVQEAALKAWLKLATLRGSDWRSWFLAIVGNQCRSTRRTRWWSVLRVGDPVRTVDPMDQGTSRAELRQALERLGHSDRIVLVMRYYLDLSFDEAARVLGISVQATRSRTQRALRRLRPKLEGSLRHGAEG